MTRHILIRKSSLGECCIDLMTADGRAGVLDQVVEHLSKFDFKITVDRASGVVDNSIPQQAEPCSKITTRYRHQVIPNAGFTNAIIALASDFAALRPSAVRR